MYIITTNYKRNLVRKKMYVYLEKSDVNVNVFLAAQLS